MVGGGVLFGLLLRLFMSSLKGLFLKKKKYKKITMLRSFLIHIHSLVFGLLITAYTPPLLQAYAHTIIHLHTRFYSNHARLVRYPATAGKTIGHGVIHTDINIIAFGVSNTKECSFITLKEL